MIRMARSRLLTTLPSHSVLRRTCAVQDEVGGLAGVNLSVFIGQVVQLGYRMLTRNVTLRARLAARHTRAQRPGLIHKDCGEVERNARNDGGLSVDQTVPPADYVSARYL